MDRKDIRQSETKDRTKLVINGMSQGSGGIFRLRRVFCWLVLSLSVLTGDTETGTVDDSCDLLSSLSGHIVVSSSVCALSDLRFIYVTAFMAQDNESPEFFNHHGCGACVTESMSVLTDPATYGTLNS